MSDKKIDNSPEGLLKRMRSGYKPIILKFGELEIEARLVPGHEMATAISNAKMNCKIPDGHEKKLLEGQAVMRGVLKTATTIGSTCPLGDRFLSMLTNEELVYLHDQYESKIKGCNPDFESLSYSEIAEIIQLIKKKSATASDFYMWQLAAVGKYFLERLPVTDSDAGGD